MTSQLHVHKTDWQEGNKFNSNELKRVDNELNWFIYKFSSSNWEKLLELTKENFI